MARSAEGESQKSPSQWRTRSAASAAGDHNWQEQRALLRGRQPTRRLTFWRYVRVALLLVFGVIGGAGLLALLLHRDVQFPFVAVVKTAYRHSFSPNAWAWEDLESLRSGADSLDGKTIDVIDLSNSDRPVESLLLPSADDRRQLLGQARRIGVIVFYVSLHGLVSETGAACVATPDSAPLDSATWLPVSRLLRQIRQWDLPDHVHKLLILDCNRLGANWNLGLLENTFASRLQQALEETPVPNLVILNSTSPGETAWASPEMRGTVFGQFLRLGLAGAADLPREGGNHDYHVSLRELHQYLVHRVDSWAEENRAARQIPMLIPSAPADYVLTCTLDRPLLQRLIAKFASDAAGEATLSRGQLDDLWTTFVSLRSREADSLAPLEMSDLRRRLVWLEQASQAGEAYRLEANAAEREWRRLAERVRERISRPVSAALAPQGAAAYSEAWVPGLAMKLRSLPLLARMGRADPKSVDLLARELKRLETDSSSEKLDALLTNPLTKELAGSVGIVHFLKLLYQSQQLSGNSSPTADILAAALQLQSQADTVAVPRDPRIQSWIHGAVDAADAVRRRAIDALLTGQTDPGPRESVEIAYRDAVAIENAVREALVLDDVIASELPDLARWLEWPDRDRDPSEPSADALSNNLLALIATSHLLASSLDNPPGSGETVAAANLPFLPQYLAVRTQFEAIRKQFDDACERLVTDAKVSSADVRQAAAILELPLLSTRNSESGLTPLEQRRKIQTLYTQATRDLHRRSMESLVISGGDDPGQLDPPAADGRNSTLNSRPGQARRATFPELALLEPFATVRDKKEGQTAESADEAGARFRRILQSVPAEIEAARERHLASADEPRREWAQAARLARSAAPFIDARWQIDPVAELRRVDIQQLLLQHAERYLEDFWGPAPRGEPAFFNVATTDSIDAARMICIPNPAAAREVGEIRKLLALRQAAARRGLAVRADALLLVDQLERPTAQVAVAVAPAGADRGLPAGSAALRIADQTGKLLGPIVRFPVDPAAGSEDSKPQKLKVSLGIGQRELADTIGAATAFFRGHEFRDDLVIKTAAGTTIEAHPRQLRNARVRLNGSQRQRASVVFVLDCSASMRKKMPFESADVVVPRMEVAKAALMRMLDALAARGDARVGVLLYGHRVGWSTKEPNQLLTQASWGGAFPEGLKPYEDIETILPLGRFDNVAAAKVAQRLEKVKPWGETPLYLSLTQALREFKDEDPDAQRSIVVITDGVNYQFNPRPDKAKTAQDVLAADSARHIRLHIVGFGIQADEAQEAQREFGRLAGETGGRYVSVSEAAALAETLEDILQRRPYTVVSPTGKTYKAQAGTAIDVNWERDEPQNFTVAIDELSEPIELSGGEAVELFVSPDEQSMISAAYNAGAPIFGTLVGGSPHDPDGIVVGVHQPLHEGTTVTFDVSLQHAQQHFVRRPREVWIEITPILSNNRPAANLKYVVYDPEFVPQTPVPVLRSVARGWPKDARRARIDFWCKWTTTEPSLVVPFSELPGADQPAPPASTLDGIPGLSYQVREKPGTPLRVDFIETYSPDVSGNTMIKVDITGPIVPSRTLHQFDAANRFATHSFLFEGAPEQALRSSASVRVISRRRMLDDAGHLEVPMFVEVPSQTDTLPALP